MITINTYFIKISKLILWSRVIIIERNFLLVARIPGFNYLPPFLKDGGIGRTNKGERHKWNHRYSFLWIL